MQGAVRAIFERARDAAAARDDFDQENWTLVIKDVIGDRPSKEDGKLRDLVDEVFSFFFFFCCLFLSHLFFADQQTHWVEQH